MINFPQRNWTDYGGEVNVSPTIMRDYYARDATVYLFKDDLLKVVDIQSP